MAIKFDGTASNYLTYDGTGANIATAGSAWSMCCWVAIDSGAGTSRAIGGACTDVAAEGTPAFFYASTANNWITYFGGLGSKIITAVDSTNWMFVAASGAGTQAQYYGTLTGAVSAGTEVQSSMGGSTTYDCVRLGSYSAGGDWFTGRIAHFRVWSGVALSSANFESERLSYWAATNTGNLYLDWALAGDITDHSGNARTGSGTGGAYTWVAGPLSGASAVPVIASYYSMLRTA